METKNMVGTIVTLAVVVVCVAAIMMPVLNDATTTEKTFTNEGVYYYGIFGTTDTYTFEFDASDGSITVNDTEIDTLSGVTSGTTYSLLATDDTILRYGYNSSNQEYYLQTVGATNASTADTIVATISEGALSVTYTTDGTDTVKTISFTELYAIVPTEDAAVLKQSSSEVYIKGDSELFASGLTTVTAWTNMFHFEGTYDDGITISSGNTAATFDNIEWNIEEVDGYEDLYKLTSIEFDITISDTTKHATYSYFAVPTEVTAEKTVHFSDGENTLLNAIPVLVIVALVIGAVGIAITSRRD